MVKAILERGFMGATSFKCDDDLMEIIDKIKKKTGKSQTRILNDTLRFAFENQSIIGLLKETHKLHLKSIFILKEVVKHRENGDQFIQQIEADFERFYRLNFQDD